MIRAFFLGLFCCLFALPGFAKPKTSHVQFFPESTTFAISIDAAQLKNSSLQPLITYVFEKSDLRNYQEFIKDFGFDPLKVIESISFAFGPSKSIDEPSFCAFIDHSINQENLKAFKNIISEQAKLLKKGKGDLYRSDDASVYFEDQFLMFCNTNLIDQALSAYEKESTLSKKYPDLVKNMKDALFSLTLFKIDPEGGDPLQDYIFEDHKDKLAFLDQLKDLQILLSDNKEELKIFIATDFKQEDIAKVVAEEVRNALDETLKTPKASWLSALKSKIEFKQDKNHVECSIALPNLLVNLLVQWSIAMAQSQDGQNSVNKAPKETSQNVDGNSTLKKKIDDTTPDPKSEANKLKVKIKSN